MPTARRPAPAIDLDAATSRARSLLDVDGCVKLSTLGPKASHTALTERLRAAGFEVTKSVVRRPLRDQLLEAAAHGTFVPMKSIASFVHGATAAEARAAASLLVRERRLVLVLRGTVEVLAASGTPTYTREELTTRQRALMSLSKTIAAALKPGPRTVLQADVLESLQEAFPELSRPRSPTSVTRPSPPSASDALGKLLAALDATRDEALGLSFIPRVVKHLRPDVGLGAAHATLLDAASRGLVELRPEGGLGRLSGEELELCLPGPQGTRLSWARRIEGRT